jgi:hypothetical protein
MKERLVTLACALGALALFVTLFLRGAGTARPEITLPTSIELGDNGLSAALRWLEHERVPVRSLRRRFDALLARGDLAPRGNLLIVSLPAALPYRVGELHALDQWLRAGNTLLVLAAIADRPDWAAGRAFHADLGDLTGIDYRTVRVGAAAPQGPAADADSGLTGLMLAARRRLASPERTVLIPNRPHAYLAGMSRAYALSDFPWRTFPWEASAATVPRGGFLLCLAHQRETGEGVLWVRPRGEGTLIVSGFASLFSNRAIGLGDNARLLANIVAASLAPGGAVLFDDEHQGLTDAYDPAKFYRDRRLAATAAIVAALWLTWVLGGTRLRVATRRAAAPREAQLVTATGLFLARVLGSAAAARRMFENFFHRLCAARRLPAGPQPPWELIEHHPRVAPAEVAQLRSWYAAACAQRRVPLARLHNLMVRIERQLAA